MRTRQIDVPPSPLSMKWGNAGGASGSVLDPGSNDWTVVRSALGVYVITFIKPFTSMPIITATPYYGGNGISANVQARSVSGFTVAAFQFSPYTPVDSNIMFIAVGLLK